MPRGRAQEGEGVWRGNLGKGLQSSVLWPSPPLPLSSSPSPTLSPPSQLDLLLGRAYVAWGRVADAAAVYDGIIASWPDDFRGYLAKVSASAIVPWRHSAPVIWIQNAWVSLPTVHLESSLMWPLHSCLVLCSPAASPLCSWAGCLPPGARQEGRCGAHVPSSMAQIPF